MENISGSADPIPLAVARFSLHPFTKCVLTLAFGTKSSRNLYWRFVFINYSKTLTFNRISSYFFSLVELETLTASYSSASLRVECLSRLLPASARQNAPAIGTIPHRLFCA